MEGEDSITGILSENYLKLAEKKIFFFASAATARDVRKNDSQGEGWRCCWLRGDMLPA